MREYTDYIRVMLKPGEKEKIYERMKEASRLLRINANNINQYAKRANETGSIYLEDIKDIQRSQEELWILMKEILQRLSTI